MKKVLSRKINILALLLTIIVIATSTEISFAKPISNDNNYVVTVNNLSTKTDIAQKQMETSLSNKGVTSILDQIEIKENKYITINGTLAKDNKNTEFKLYGELKRADDSKDIIVGSLIDNTNTFDVVYFSINNNSDKFISATGIKREGITLNLYLCERGSRNFYFIEKQVPENINTLDLFNNVSSLSNCDAGDIFWLAKVFTPKVTSKIIEKSDKIDSKAQNTLASVYMDQKSIFRRFYFNYIWISQEYNELIDIDHYFKFPTTPHNQLQGIIEVSFCETVNVTKGQQVSTKTAATIGANNSMNIICGLGSPLNIDSVSWGGTTNQGSYNITASISFAYNITPWLSAGVSFTSPTTTTNPPVAYKLGYNMAKANLSNGQYLRNIGDKFNGLFNYLIPAGTQNVPSTTSVYMRYKYTITHPVAPQQTYDDYLSATIPL